MKLMVTPVLSGVSWFTACAFRDRMPAFLFLEHAAMNRVSGSSSSVVVVSLTVNHIHIQPTHNTLPPPSSAAPHEAPREPQYQHLRGSVARPQTARSFTVSKDGLANYLAPVLGQSTVRASDGSWETGVKRRFGISLNQPQRRRKALGRPQPSCRPRSTSVEASSCSTLAWSKRPRASTSWSG